LRSALDTNVIAYLVAGESAAATAASDILGEARLSGALIICGVVYAELFAHPKLTPSTLNHFLLETGVDVDFDIDENIWRQAGLRYSKYGVHRRKARAGTPRRLLADFVIGAHALLRADRLITFDAAGFRSDFPELQLHPRKVQ
jgi:predicted nucleic acid-binding protein